MSYLGKHPLSNDVDDIAVDLKHAKLSKQKNKQQRPKPNNSRGKRNDAFREKIGAKILAERNEKRKLLLGDPADYENLIFLIEIQPTNPLFRFRLLLVVLA